MSTVDWRVSIRLTTNAGASFTSTGRLPSLRGDVPGGRERRIVRRGRPHHLDEREDGDRVEEVQPDDPLGMLEPLGHRRDREGRGVRDEQALGRDDPLERPEDLTLHGQLLEHRLEHEVAALVRLDPVAGRDDRAEEAGLPLGEATLCDEPRQVAADRLHGLPGTLRVDVGHDDGHLEPAHEERRELGRHQPGADHPDPLDPSRLRVRDPVARLMRRSTTSNA